MNIMPLMLRQMNRDDIELGMRLKQQAGWNQTPDDWRRFLELEPEGCFVGEWGGQPVATTTTCTFGPIGWIAMVLVDESFRHRGIATQMVEHALAYLAGRSVTTVRLDATKYGRPVYERMGFAARHDLMRLQGIARPAAPGSAVDPVHAEDLNAVARLDGRATGTDRSRLLERLVAEHPELAGIARDGQSEGGYVLLRPGANATQIGPAVARAEAAGRALCNWALTRCAGQAVFIDVPVGNPAAIEWARSAGLAEQRRFTRMDRGQPIEEDVQLLWASSGPEKG
ncbi:MAG: GNAT family N-acetyltransferase [Planctomycetaceae bacterium]|nr:GNAT family N-acetyltransferase [Planctomycetaceae bacterium]